MRLKEFVVTSVAAVAVAVGGAGVAIAAVEHVDGGTWDYGEEGDVVWSDYHHPDNCHSSSVKVGDRVIDSGPTRKGEWSRVKAEASLWSAESAYYKSKREDC